MNPEEKVNRDTSVTVAKIEEAIKTLELRLTLNAQSLIPITSNTPDEIINPSIVAHNKRANQVIDECQTAIAKLRFLNQHAQHFSEAELLDLFQNYNEFDVVGLREKVKQKISSP